MTANVILLNPPQCHFSKCGISSFPLGLAYIASNLLEERFKVSILDCYLEGRTQFTQLDNQLYRIGLSDEEINQRIKEVRPDVVGISIPFSTQYYSALDLAKLIRNTFPQIPLVAGGAHVSAAPESLNKSEFDYLIVGEGEKAFAELVVNLVNGNCTDLAFPNIYSRDQNRNFITHSPSTYISDIDSLPFPAYHLLPLKKAWSKRVPYANILATRGCPHNCNFCSIHSVMGKTLRKRSVENIIEEIVLLYEKHGVREVFFEDDNLTASISWAKELFYRISRQNIDIEIGVRNGIRADRIDKELLQLMKKAGCSRVCFAPESGDQHILDKIIGKNLELAEVEKAVVLASGVGLNVTCFFVIGLPDETKDDIQKTIDFARKLKILGCDSIDINCATPYPGTRLYNECRKRGYISDELDYSQLHTGVAVISTPNFTAKEITSLRLEAMQNLKENFAEKTKRMTRSFFDQPSLFIKKRIRGFLHRIF